MTPSLVRIAPGKHIRADHVAKVQYHPQRTFEGHSPFRSCVVVTDTNGRVIEVECADTEEALALADHIAAEVARALKPQTEPTP